MALITLQYKYKLFIFITLKNDRIYIVKLKKKKSFFDDSKGFIITGQCKNSYSWDNGIVAKTSCSKAIEN